MLNFVLELTEVSSVIWLSPIKDSIVPLVYCLLLAWLLYWFASKSSWNQWKVFGDACQKDSSKSANFLLDGFTLLFVKNLVYQEFYCTRHEFWGIVFALVESICWQSGDSSTVLGWRRRSSTNRQPKWAFGGIQGMKSW